MINFTLDICENLFQYNTLLLSRPAPRTVEGAAADGNEGLNEDYADASVSIYLGRASGLPGILFYGRRQSTARGAVMRITPVYAATIALTFVMTASSHAPPPSNLSSLFPGDGWEKCCAAVKQLYEPAALREYRIYVLPEIVGPSYAAQELHGEPLEGPDAESWLFFVDEVPPANWGHPCRLVFITTDSYEITEHECQFPPANVDEFRDVTKEALALLCE